MGVTGQKYVFASIVYRYECVCLNFKKSDFISKKFKKFKDIFRLFTIKKTFFLKHKVPTLRFFNFKKKNS
jgi:cytochrome b subunit of formate dehydrogenase